LTDKYEPKRKPSDEYRSDNELFKDTNLVRTSKLLTVLRSIAGSRTKTVSQIALNWLITELKVIPIPGAKNANQAEQNAGAAGWKLTEQESYHIARVLEQIHIDYF
jgi:aryl-alcohol dehydrogenase-like predicted oxidoreductase